MKLADLFNEGVNDPGIFKAVFLAGGPGSGKSFVGGEVFAIPSANSFSPAGLKVVNSDPEFEYFLKKQGIDPKTLGKMTDKQFQKVTTGPESPREKAKRIKDAKEKLYVHGRLGLLIDGTGDDYAKIKKKVVELRKLGYDCYMIFVNTSLEVALERNAARDRVLPEKLVTKIWKDVQKNIGRFQGLFKGQMIIIDNSDRVVVKSGKPTFGKVVDRMIKQFVSSPIKSKIAKNWMKSQRGK